MSKPWPEGIHECAAEGCHTQTYYAYCAICGFARSEAKRQKYEDQPTRWQQRPAWWTEDDDDEREKDE